MPLPNEAILIGATRWLHELRDGNEQHAFEILKAAPQYSGLTPTQYMSALEWLKGTELLDNPAVLELPAGQLGMPVLEAALAVGNPLWLADADQNVTTADELPADLVAASEQLGLTATQCLHAVQNVHGKIDLESRARLGSVGELALMRLLAESGDGTPVHVAATSDSYGYDIYWSGNRETAALEVKTTTRRGRLSIHLSRHEFEVSRRERNWNLVIVLLDQNDAITAVATLSSTWVHTHAPRDGGHHSKWDSAALAPPREALAPGLPIRPLDFTHAGGQLISRGVPSKGQPPGWWPSNMP